MARSRALSRGKGFSRSTSGASVSLDIGASVSLDIGASVSLDIGASVCYKRLRPIMTASIAASTLVLSAPSRRALTDVPSSYRFYTRAWRFS